MQVKDLLKRRFKIIADYPSNVHKIGSIISNEEVGFIDKIKFYECEKHPHLFKELEWYENRTIDEMPQYLKDNLTGVVKKVFKHFTYILTDGSNAGEHNADAVCSFDEDAERGFEKLFWRYDCCQPTTETDFLEQQGVSTK